MPYFSSKDISKDGLYYVYFWLKYGDVASLGKATSKTLQQRGVLAEPISLKPTRIKYKPQPKSIIFELLARDKVQKIKHRIRSAELLVELGLDSKNSTFNFDRYVDLHHLPPGTKLAAARKWIKSEEGKKWAGDAACVLGQIAVDVVNRE